MGFRYTCMLLPCNMPAFIKLPFHWLQNNSDYLTSQWAYIQYAWFLRYQNASFNKPSSEWLSCGSKVQPALHLYHPFQTIKIHRTAILLQPMIPRPTIPTMSVSSLSLGFLQLFERLLNQRLTFCYIFPYVHVFLCFRSLYCWVFLLDDPYSSYRYTKKCTALRQLIYFLLCINVNNKTLNSKTGVQALF